MIASRRVSSPSTPMTSPDPVTVIVFAEAAVTANSITPTASTIPARVLANRPHMRSYSSSAVLRRKVFLATSASERGNFLRTSGRATGASSVCFAAGRGSFVPSCRGNLVSCWLMIFTPCVSFYRRCLATGAKIRKNMCRETTYTGGEDLECAGPDGALDRSQTNPKRRRAPLAAALKKTKTVAGPSPATVSKGRRLGRCAGGIKKKSASLALEPERYV